MFFSCGEFLTRISRQDGNIMTKGFHALPNFMDVHFRAANVWGITRRNHQDTEWTCFISSVFQHLLFSGNREVQDTYPLR